jgi:hypothetical protein
LYFEEVFDAPVVSSIFSKDGFTGPNRKVWAFFLGEKNQAKPQGLSLKCGTYDSGP